MKIKTQILKFIQKAYENALYSNSSTENQKSVDPSSQDKVINELFDGMSTGTARIIIERKISQAFAGKFNIDHVKNEGRYYVAKIVRPDGSTIQRLLVDKQTGSIQMVGRY